MDFNEGDLVCVRPYREFAGFGENFSLGLVIDVDPSESAPTYYLISIPGSESDWYHEDSVFSMQQVIDAS